MIITADEVYNRLETFGETSSDYCLELKNLGLTQLPNNISLNIGQILLDNNQLTRVPDWVIESAVLEISLINNQITYLSKKQCKNADRYKKIVKLDNNNLLEYQLRNQERILILNNEYCLKRSQVIKTSKIKEITNILEFDTKKRKLIKKKRKINPNDLITYETLKENKLIKSDYEEFKKENKAGLIINLIKKEPEKKILYQLLRIQDNKEKLLTIDFYKTFNKELKEIYNETLDEMIFKEKRLFRKERILQL